MNAGYGANFSDGFRWSATATDGAGLLQGDGTTLLWSIAPDGLSVEGETSNFISFLDSYYGAEPGGTDLTLRPWFPILSNGLDSLSSKTGLTFSYVTDDSASWGGTPSNGSRGDIRFAGYDLPTSGELGRATLPTFGGDVLLDTANSSLTNSNLLRALLQHEVGHALGLGHVAVAGASALMGTGNLPQNGPQFDDLYALTRLYGDRYEAGAGNNGPATATNLGAIIPATPLAVGTDAGGLGVLTNQTDFVTIDNDADYDYYRIETSGPTKITVELSPRGPTYSFAPIPAGGQGTQTLAAQVQSDLSFTLYGADGVTPIATIGQTGIGEAESLSQFDLPVAGDYFLAVGGADDANQFYRLDVATESSTPRISPTLYYDGFDTTSTSPNSLLDVSGRQARGRLNSPYDLSATTAGGLVTLNSGDLLLVATDAGAETEAVVAAPMRNFGTEVVGERWLLSLNANLTSSIASDLAAFSLVIDDNWPAMHPDASGVTSNDSALTLRLTPSGSFTIAENGGNASGEANITGTSAGPQYLIQLLVDETQSTPTMTLTLNGETVLTGESIPLGTMERYFSLQAATLGTAATGDSFTARVDSVSLVNLADAVAGDYNYDGQVNLADFTLWRDSLGRSVLPGTAADGDGSGTVDTADYSLWQASYSAVSLRQSTVPEPATHLAAVLGSLLMILKYTPQDSNLQPSDS